MTATAPVIDSHAHLWRRARTPQPWIDPRAMAVIDADFWMPDLAAIQAASGIDGSIVVQSSNDPGETRDLLELSTGDSIRGVVGWIDLEADVPGQVAELRACPGGEHLVGIRHLVHQDPDPNWLGRASVGHGLEQLAALGLPFDLVVLPTQLPLAARVIGEHPEVRFVLDHLGKPPIVGGDLVAWHADLAAVAAHPNVVAKLSGLTVEADWASWSAADLAPVVAHALAEFGVERLLWGSDWPLVNLTRGLDDWVAGARYLLPDETHGAIFGANTIRTYFSGAPHA